MDYRIYYSIFTLFLMLDKSLSKFNQTRDEDATKKLYVNLLNTLVNVNKERLQTHTKLTKLNDYYGKDHLRTLIDKDNVEPKIFLVLDDSDETKSGFEVDMQKLINNLENNHKNKLHPHFHNFNELNTKDLQRDSTDNYNNEFWKQKFKIIDENIAKNDNDGVSPSISEAVKVLNILEDDNNKETYLRKWGISDSSEDDSEKRDRPSLEKFHETDDTNTARQRSISCRRGRKRCRSACRESARNFCNRFNLKRCSYRSRCRGACRMWF